VGPHHGNAYVLAALHRYVIGAGGAWTREKYAMTDDTPHRPQSQALPAPCERPMLGSLWAGQARRHRVRIRCEYGTSRSGDDHDKAAADSARPSVVAKAERSEAAQRKARNAAPTTACRSTASAPSSPTSPP
jgi:hypothetical protein